MYIYMYTMFPLRSVALQISAALQAEAAVGGVL